MIRRLLCWLGDLLGRDWHKWENDFEVKSEYEPELIHGVDICRYCEKVKLIQNIAERLRND